MKGLAFALALGALLPQVQSPTTARLVGVVVEDGSNPARPLRRALVTVTGTNLATPLQVVTDDNGRFVVTGLSAGRFSVTAEKPGYLKTYYGSAKLSRPPGMPIAVAAGEQPGDLTVRLIKGAAISGTVREANGLGLAGAQIQLSLVTFENGQRKLVNPPTGGNISTADDRGEYRIWGLTPGEYVVRSVSGGAPGASSARTPTDAEFAAARDGVAGGSSAAPNVQLARLPTYHPGVTDVALAQGIVVAAGDERLGIDIVSRMGTVARVSGVTTGPDGRPVTDMVVGIANVTTNSLHSSPGIVRPNASGEFAINGLTPGRWLLFGRGAEPGTPSDGRYPWWTYTEFELTEQSLSGLVLPFSTGSTITGRITFDGTAPRPDLSRVRIGLTHLPVVSGADTFLSPVTPAADGTFAFESVPPGRYRPTISATGAWTLRGAQADGRDVFDAPLEIETGRNASIAFALTDRATEISGSLLDQLGRPAPEYSVVVFSADPVLRASPRRSSGLVKIGSDGRYRVAGLPAGEYFLCVVTDLEPAQLRDPAMLEQLSQAGIRVTLADGDKKVQDLKLGGK